MPSRRGRGGLAAEAGYSGVPVDVEITPDPSDAEREAILSALELDTLPAPGPWIEPLGEDQEP